MSLRAWPTTCGDKATVMRVLGALLLSGAMSASAWAEGDACAALQAAWSQQLRPQAWGMQVDCSGWRPDQHAALAQEACEPAAAPLPWRAGGVSAAFKCAGGRQRSLPVRLRMSSEAWVAVQPMAAQAVLRPADLVRQQVVWRDGGTAPLERPSLAGLRLRRAVQAGQALMPGDVMPDEVVPARAAVTVVLHQSGLRLEMPGLLVADAQVGGRARAQLQGRRALMDGQLATATTLVVEDQR